MNINEMNGSDIISTNGFRAEIAPDDNGAFHIIMFYAHEGRVKGIAYPINELDMIIEVLKSRKIEKERM